LTRRPFDYIRTFYSQPDPARVLDRPYPWLNEATMSRFVEDSTAVTLIRKLVLDYYPNLVIYYLGERSPKYG